MVSRTSLFTVLLAALSILWCCADAASFVGEVSVNHDLRVFATVKVQFKTEQSDTSSQPRLSIGASRPVSLNDILSYGSNGEIYLKAPSSASPGTSSSYVHHVGLMSLLSPFLLSFAFGSKKRLTLMVAVTAALASVIFAQSNSFELEVTLFYSSGYQFNTVQIELDDGSITSTSGLLSVGDLLLNVKSQNGIVGLNLLSVGSRLEVSAASSVTLERLSVGSNIQTTVTSTESSVFLSFLTGLEYHGAFSVEFGDSVELPSDCQVASDTSNNGIKTQIGQCFASSSGSMVLKSKSTVTLRFGVPYASCNEFASVDLVPPMPAIDSSAYPGYVQKYESEDEFIGLSSSFQYLDVNSTSEGILLYKHKYANDIFALMLADDNFLPFALEPSRTYKISFSIKQAVTNEGQSTWANLTVQVYKLNEYWSVPDNATRRYVTGYTEGSAPTNSKFVIASPNLAPKGITNEWANYSFTFSPPSVASRPFFAIQGSYGGTGYYYYKDITFELLEKPTTNLQLFSTKVFRAANIPSMSEETEPNPRTDCPHLQDGLKKWEDASTWPGGQVPSAGSSVTLPANTKVLVTPCSFSAVPYNEITIPSGSELIFADAPIELNVGTIWVNGALRMGSQTCRLFSTIKVTFHGTKASSPTEGKGIVGSIGSVIEMHGKLFNPTWTRLAAPASPGSDRVILQQKVNWEAGQKVVLVTSFFHDDYQDMNEVLTIRAVKENVVQFTSRVQFYHHAGAEYQTEIGLLSRRIQLSGDAQSDDEQFGGHLMMMGEGRVSGIETNRMGQYNMLGRYPIHFHLMGISPTSYATDNSVHDSYFRCITIHGTHEVLVSRNVAFRTHGHCYYIEDGVEENNTISYNLAVRVAFIGPVTTSGTQFMSPAPATPDRILPADGAASGFYISNMWNYVQGNAASGGWAGFALPHFVTPTGAFKDTPFVIAPKDKAALLFDGNTAHSSGYYFAIFGGCLYSGGLLFYNSNGTLMYNGGRTQGNANRNAKMWVNGTVVDTSLNITNFKAWMCGQGTNHWGNDVEFRNSESWDSGRGATLFGPSFAADSVFGLTPNPLGYPKEGKYGDAIGHQGFQFYDQWSQAILSNVTFVGFKNDSRFTSRQPNSGTNCLSVLNDVPNAVNQGISAVTDLHFDDCDDSVRVQNDLTSARKSSNIVDWDGSVTGITGGAIIGSWAGIWNGGPDCHFDWNWLTWVCPRKPGREVINVELSIPSYIGQGATPADINAVAGAFTLCGTDATRRVNFTFNERSAVGLSGEGWFLTFPNNGMPKSFQILPTRVPPTAKTVVVMSYPAGTTFQIRYQNMYYRTPSGNYTQVSSVAQVVNTPFTYYFSGTYLYVNVKNYLAIGTEDYTRDGVTVWGVNGFSSPIYIDASCTASVATNFCPVSTTSLPPSLNMLT